MVQFFFNVNAPHILAGLGSLTSKVCVKKRIERFFTSLKYLPVMIFVDLLNSRHISVHSRDEATLLDNQSRSIGRFVVWKLHCFLSFSALTNRLCEIIGADILLLYEAILHLVSLTSTQILFQEVFFALLFDDSIFIEFCTS